MKNIKNILFGTIISIFAITPIISTHAYASHQGSQPIYGHFGQPHGYSISGDFTFIVQVHGAVDRVTFKIVKANDINNIIQNRTQTSITDAGNGDKLYNLEFNSTTLENGDYKLFADVENDTATPNGWRDFVVHYDGTNHLDFSVNNPKVVPPPITNVPVEDTCSSKLTKANNLTEKIYNKQKENFNYVDNFMQVSSVFAKNNSEKSYDADLKKVSEKRKIASDQLVELNNIKTLSCNSSLKEQVNNFLSHANKTRDSLDNYKDSVIDFILVVIGDVK